MDEDSELYDEFKEYEQDYESQSEAVRAAIRKATKEEGPPDIRPPGELVTAFFQASTARQTLVATKVIRNFAMLATLVWGFALLIPVLSPGTFGTTAVGLWSFYIAGALTVLALNTAEHLYDVAGRPHPELVKLLSRWIP